MEKFLRYLKKKLSPSYTNLTALGRANQKADHRYPAKSTLARNRTKDADPQPRPWSSCIGAESWMRKASHCHMMMETGELIHLPVMNCPVFPSLDNIYCTLCKWNLKTAWKTFFLRKLKMIPTYHRYHTNLYLYTPNLLVIIGFT